MVGIRTVDRRAARQAGHVVEALSSTPKLAVRATRTTAHPGAAVVDQATPMAGASAGPRVEARLSSMQRPVGKAIRTTSKIE